MQKSEYKVAIFVALLAILSGILYAILPFKYVAFLLAVIAGTVLVIWKVEAGLLAAAFILPFLPTIATLGLTVLIIISFIIKVCTNNIKIKFSPLNIWLVIFGGLTLLYAITSVTPKSSIQVAFVTLSYIVLYFVTINTVKDKKMLYMLILTLVCSATLESLYGIYQYKIGIPTIDENWTDISLFPEMTTRVFGTLDNPNILAQYLELMIPLALGLFWVSKSFIKKLLFLGAIAIMAICLVFTFSRGGWIALALSVLVFGLLKDRRFLVLALILGVASLFFLPNSITDRLTSIGNLSESSNSYRAFIWTSAFKMVQDFWYSGVGVGVKAFEKLYNTLYIREGVYAFHTHSLYLQMLVEMGVLGFLSFLAVIFMTLKHGLTAFLNSKDNLNKTIMAALISGMTGFLFHGLWENSFYNFKIVFLFWFIISLIMALREIESTSKEGYFKY